jgi:hypothetical protein
MNIKKIFLKTFGVIILLIIMFFAGIFIYSKYNIIKFNNLSCIKDIKASSLKDTVSDSNVNIKIDSRDVISEISPYIYGSSWSNWIDKLPPKEELKMLNISTIRFGGNDFSRFDSKTEVFYKKSGMEKSKQDMGENLKWFTDSRVQPILQINMLGIAIDSVTKEQIIISTPVDAVNFLKKIRAKYGIAIQYITLDNEPLIWSDTHDDLHPNPTSYDEYCEKFIKYAKAIKDYDKNIMIMGPESCNPYFYYKSDSKEDTNNGIWLQYFLKRCSDYEKANNIRLLDILTVHRYPIFRNFNDLKVTASNQKILDSTEGWWNTEYTDEIDPTAYGDNGIIPNLKKWINANYPGTKIGITEYNLDYDSKVKYDPIVRAIWLADTLGVFAKNGVDFANHWNLQEDADHGLITNRGFSINNVSYGDKQPVFYSFYLMSNFLRGSLIHTNSSNKNVKVYGAINQNSTNIVVINSDFEKDYTCNIFADTPLLDEKSFLFKSKTITVFEVKDNQVKIYSCDFK